MFPRQNESRSRWSNADRGVVLVTGASSGIGLVTAQALRREAVLRAANAASPKRRYTAGKAAGQVRIVRRFLPEFFVGKNIRKFSRLSD
jgi:NAD(P)-dependent dehydrogenase (short-subunit alcohol dehydrogenase family)